MTPRAPLCIELHDVAPATWSLCQRILARIDARGLVPVSLLVVPDYHHRGYITRDGAFLRAINQRLARGDEIALHGLHHLDEGPVARSPKEWLQRRVRTLSEGEFAATDARVSAERIARGLAEFVAAGWRGRGFVPPAWLLGAGARAVLDGFGFTYVALRDGLVALPGWTMIETTTLSYAAFSPWRRALSRPALAWQLQRAPLLRPLRLAIHPVDARHPGVLAHWEHILDVALSTRVPMHAERIVAQHGHDSGIADGVARDVQRARADVASRP
ncbi:MAG: polysaccharide deacetylase family protein [Casimicrobiaceae bacterium]